MLHMLWAAAILIPPSAMAAMPGIAGAYEPAPGTTLLSTEALIAAPENAALAEAITRPPAEKDRHLLTGKRIAIIAESGVEEIELTFPHKYFADRGATTQHLITRNGPSDFAKGVIVSPTRDTHIFTFRALSPGGYFPIGGFIEDVRPDEYDALILPGGYSPDNCRSNPNVTSFVRAMFTAGKPVGAICHGPSLLISAGVLKGKNATSWFSIRDDLRNAGANIIEDAPVVDGNLITARYPPDLLVFVEAIQKQLLQQGQVYMT
jgi:protease I